MRLFPNSLSIPVVLFAASVCPAIAYADLPGDPLAMARTASLDGPIYAFDMTYRLGDMIAEGRIDPTYPEGQRINIKSPARREWTDDFEQAVERLDAQADGNIWCQEYLKHVPEDAEPAARTDTSVTYTFTPKPEPDADGAEKKLFRSLIGTAVIDAKSPALLSFQIHLPAPMKPNLMAKVNHFSMFVQCERAPDGRTYRADLDLEVEGSAIGQSFAQKTQQRIYRLFEPANPE
ncbi:MAG: hypothetical protein AAGJ32_04170 [Pseudomonadota bacterium]